MSELYRIKFRSEQFELEVESTDKEFISSKMEYLIDLSSRPYEPKLIGSGTEAPEAPSSPEPEAPAASAETPPAEKKVEEAPAPKPKAKRGRKPKATAKKAKTKTAAKKKTTAKKETPAPASAKSSLDPNAVADEVKSSPHYDFIKTKILDKSNQINRILVSFYFAQGLSNGDGLTTGEVESITEALGNAIKSTNISSQLKKYDDLFLTKGERKRGSVVYYKLNAKGKKKLEDLLSSIAS